MVFDCQKIKGLLTSLFKWNQIVKEASDSNKRHAWALWLLWWYVLVVNSM